MKPDSGKRRKAAAEAAGDLQEVAAIALGDLVVHAEHGVALCEGLEAVDAAGAPTTASG